MSSSATPPIKLLNPDVLREIFLRLSKYELLDVACVCRDWNHVAQRLIDQTLDIVASLKMQDANMRLLRRLHDSKTLQYRVAHFVIKEWHLDRMPLIKKEDRMIEDPWAPGNHFSRTFVDDHQPLPESGVLAAEICRALGAFELGFFTWSALCPAPASILEQLASTPSCKVQFTWHYRAYEAAAWTYSPVLNHVQIRRINQLSAQLVKLEVILPPDDGPLLTALGSMIASSSKLKVLKVYALGKLWAGPNVPENLKLGLGGMFTTVNSLQWLRGPVVERGGPLCLHELELDNFCLCKEESFRFSSVIHTPSLKRLGMTCFSVCRNESFPHLQSFRLNCYNRKGELDPFCYSNWSLGDVREMLSRCHSIADLDLVDGGDILDESLLERIGSRLIRLSLHSSTLFVSDMGLDLDLIKRHCHNLEDISLDAPSDQVGPWQWWICARC